MELLTGKKHNILISVGEPVKSGRFGKGVTSYPVCYGVCATGKWCELACTVWACHGTLWCLTAGLSLSLWVCGWVWVCCLFSVFTLGS
jgi:hypothetical protein